MKVKKIRHNNQSTHKKLDNKVEVECMSSWSSTEHKIIIKFTSSTNNIRENETDLLSNDKIQNNVQSINMTSMQ